MTPPVLDIQQVTLTFSGLDKPVLSDIHYQVNAGDFIVILGTNGSGKSSLLKLLDRRYRPSSGHIFLDGQSLSGYTAKKWSGHIRTLTQNCDESLFTSLTVLENYLLIRQQHAPEREFFSHYLLAYHAGLASKLDQMVAQLSGGEKQALALALAMLNPPRILLLDEHTSALDPNTAEKIMLLTRQLVEQHRITCLLTTHDLEIAEHYGNRILALKNGEIHQVIENDDKKNLGRHSLLSTCY